LIGECRVLVESDPDALSALEIGLALAGYSPAHDDDYDQTFFRVAEEAVFAVKDNFPRITRIRLLTKFLKASKLLFTRLILTPSIIFELPSPRRKGPFLVIRVPMADVLTPEQRSYNMSRIRNRDTRPEIIVRSIVHRMGYRYRLHKKDLPGKLMSFSYDIERLSCPWLLLSHAQMQVWECCAGD